MAQITMDLKDYEKLKKEANKKEYYKSMYEHEQEEVERVKEFGREVEIMLKLLLFKEGDQFIGDDVLHLFAQADRLVNHQIVWEGSVREQGAYIKLTRKREE